MKSVQDVAKIADPFKRMVAAATLSRQAEAKADGYRQKRDLAILVMLRPFADAVAATNAERKRLRDALEAGHITEDGYAVGLAKNREQRQRDLREANVVTYPVHVYEMLGVSRNLVNRILMRMPTEALPDMRDPKRSAKAAHAKIGPLEQIIDAAKEIRDTAALLLMAGEDDAGNEVAPVSNADVARATGLTTARIAQLRESIR
jgi:hypothetical protein